MSSGPWMVCSARPNQTSSFETFLDSTATGQGYVKGQDVAYIGQTTAQTEVSTSFWATGSAQANSPDEAMFTPYPGGGLGGDFHGKLYFMTAEAFNDPAISGSVPSRGQWVNLDLPSDPGYVIVTPQTTSPGIYRYAFSDIDDLIDNGFRITQGDGNSFDKTKWDNIVSNTDWNNYSLDPTGTTAEKEQIVACTLAGTSAAKQISGGTLDFKGAILMAFGGTGGATWGKTGYIVGFGDDNLNL